MEHLFDCHVTVKGHSKPFFHNVWATSAAQAKEKLCKAAAEQGVTVTKITARKSF